jgi:hypothetical protein
MRFKEFRKLLSEVSMKPGSLKKQALAINALCGIEFELYYPIDLSSVDIEDEDADNFESIVNFFEDSGRNVRYSIERFLDDLYSDYTREYLSQQWKDHYAEDAVREYILNNEWDEKDKFFEIYDDMELSDEEIEQAEQVRTYNEIENSDAVKNYNKAKEKFDDELESEVDHSMRRQDSIYDAAFEDWSENESPPDEEDCLRDAGIYTMMDAYNRLKRVTSYIGWPSGEIGDDEQMEQIANDFSNATDYKATTSYRYKNERYVVEEDSSLTPRNGYIGAEIVSPALSIGEMVKHLHIVTDWAIISDCYTDENCGLHMNVSLQDFDLLKLDYVKLTLFLGDDYVLNQFQRELNTYCKSALTNIRGKINDDPTIAYRALESIKSNLSNIAGHIIHENSTEKFTSINIHENRIEFRGPGNDWMNMDISLLENTIYRFVVALDIACDPEKFKKEYAKKLYKLVNPHAEWSSLINQYSQYQAGLIDVKTAKAQLTTKQQQRAQTAKPVLPDNSWNVTAPTGQSLVVVANSQKGAINQARTQLKLNAVQYPDTEFTAEPNRQTDIFRNL